MENLNTVVLNQGSGIFLFQLGAFEKFRTKGLQLAFLAMGLARSADITPMQQQPVVGIGDVCLRNMFREGHLHLIRRVVALAHKA